MKNLFAILITLALVFTACDNEAIDNDTTLKIRNESYIEITDVIWNNVSFTDSQSSIKTGTSMTKAVQAGSGYIYFRRQGNPIAVRTRDVVTVAENEQKEFVFTNNTIIAEVSNHGNNETLQTFYTKPWINIKQNTDAVDLYGEYDFGSILAGTEKDITFTIENIGGGNLVVENVNGNRINLEENTSGYFSIIQQPLAPTVAPENATVFTIRFSPAVTGSNFSATVLIKTNSQNAQEFSFRVKGNGRNYIIGDTGQAGGIIFYDAGVVIDGWRYLEAALTDFSASWGADDIDIAGTGLSIGSGKQNTQIIIETLDQLGETGQAAQLCADLNFGGYNDWFLPSRDELNLLYQNLHKAGLGSFRTDLYWTSSQRSARGGYYVWLRRFSDGSQMDDAMGFWYTRRNADNSVRAIRAF
jgi:hypothetical protein